MKKRVFSAKDVIYSLSNLKYSVFKCENFKL